MDCESRYRMKFQEPIGMDAENIQQVFDWLWSSGQLSKADVFRLKQFGFDVVINLALPSSTNALPAEAEMVTGMGLTYIQIPVIWETPRSTA